MPQHVPKLLFVLFLMPDLTIGESQDCLPLSRFEKFTPCSTLADVIAEAGEPVADIGSGIHIKQYNICGGGTVYVGAPSMAELFYINYSASDGSKKSLLAGKPDCPETHKSKRK